MSRALVVTAAAAALLAGCSSKSPADSPARQPSPVATSAPAVRGLINITLCNSHKVSIEANTNALAAEETMQHAEAAARLRAQIAADRRAIAAIPGCRINR